MCLLLLHYRPKASGVSDEATTFVETHQVLNKLFEVDLRGVNDASGVLKVRDKNPLWIMKIKNKFRPMIFYPGKAVFLDTSPEAAQEWEKYTVTTAELAAETAKHIAA